VPFAQIAQMRDEGRIETDLFDGWRNGIDFTERSPEQAARRADLGGTHAHAIEGQAHLVVRELGAQKGGQIGDDFAELDGDLDVVAAVGCGLGLVIVRLAAALKADIEVDEVQIAEFECGHGKALRKALYQPVNELPHGVIARRPWPTKQSSPAA